MHRGSSGEKGRDSLLKRAERVKRYIFNRLGERMEGENLQKKKS